MVYEDTYTCKSCGAFGKTSQLLSRLNKSGFSPSYGYQEEQTLYNPFHRWLKKETLSQVLKRARNNAKFNPIQLDYIINTRKITPKECSRLGIGVLGDFFTFPVVDPNNTLVGGVVRAREGLGSRYFVPHGQNPNLLYSPGWKRVEEASTVFLTFGGFDAISLYQLGFASISTVLGKNLDFTALNPVRKRIVIIPDHGEEVEANKLAAKLDWRGVVCYFPYPHGTKDMNDVYRIDPALITTTLKEFVHDNVAINIGNSMRQSYSGANC
jgi:hypothetical protein